MYNPENIYSTATHTAKYHILRQECETRQIGDKRQDHASQGSFETPEGHVYWGAIFDGHGNDQAIQLIRKAPLHDIMKSNTPYHELQTLLIEDMDSRQYTKLHSGSTMVYVKITEKKDHIEIEVVNIGDSQSIVWINDKPIFMTQPQNAQNGKEIARLLLEDRLDPMEPVFQCSTAFDVISPTTIMLKTGTFLQFVDSDDNHIELTPSQSLGHCGITGIKPEITKLYVKSSDTFKIVLFSDGVGDMIPVNGLACGSTLEFLNIAQKTTEIMDEAERRWNQAWNTYDMNYFMTCNTQSFPKDGFDDLSCVVIKGELIEK
jgi:serine/threonine protein phosphatase PrpC